MADLILLKGTGPTTPNAGDLSLFAASVDDRFYQKTSAGVESRLALYSELDALSVTGTQAAPSTVTGAGITPSASMRQLIYTVSSGGSVTLVLTSGTTVGQTLTLEGTSDTNYLSVINASNILTNGTKRLKAGVAVIMVWGGTKWTVHATNQ